MTVATQSRWRFAVLPLVMLSITLPNALRAGAFSAEAWPLWRGMILDSLLVLAGAALVAAGAFGFVAWRQGRADA